MTTSKWELKQGFRDPAGSEIGFIGREPEIQTLKNILLHRPRGSILVGGHRGVGKTSLVTHAIKSAESEQSQYKKFIRVDVSRPHLENPEGAPLSRGEQDRMQILKALVRGLHHKALESPFPKSVQEKIEALAAKAQLMELENHESAGRDYEQNKLQAKHTTKEVTFAPSRPIEIGIGAFAGAGVSAMAASVILQAGTGWGTWAVVLPLVIMGLLIGGFLVKFSRSTIQEHQRRERGENKQLQVGKYDFSPESFEHELHAILVAASGQSIRIVFVIDELDKAQNEVEELREIVSCLKNLFTLSPSIFVFICGDEYFRNLPSPKFPDRYPKDYTLFSEVLYVPVLYYRDMERLIDNALTLSDPNDPQYHKLRNFLCWESNGHVFDLIKLMISFSRTSAKGDLILELSETGMQGTHWRKGNLEGDWEIAAGLQKFIGVAYDEDSRPGTTSHRFNNLLWMALHETAGLLLSGQPVEVVDGEVKGLQSLEMIKSSKDKTDIKGAVEKMLNNMARHPTVELKGEKAPETEEPITIYSLDPDFEYPGGEIALRKPTAFEESYLEVVDKLDSIRQNSGFDLADDLDKQVEEVMEIKPSLVESQIRNAPPKSEVISRYNEGLQLIPRLMELEVDLQIKDWTDDRGHNVTTDLKKNHPINKTPIKDSLQEFSELLPVLDELEGSIGIKSFLIVTKETENQVLVVDNPRPWRKTQQ